MRISLSFKSLFEHAFMYALERYPGLVLGGVSFVVLNTLNALSHIGSPGPTDRGVMLGMLGIFTALLVIPFTRSFGIGFFIALLAFTIPQGGRFTQDWTEPVVYYVKRATAPIRLPIRRAREKRAWLAEWANRPLAVEPAISRAQQLQAGCVQLALAGRALPGVPDAMALTEPDDCRGFRRDALDVDAGWPDRFHRDDDKGWRWSLAAAPGQSRWGGPNFVITLVPEPLLRRAGPILALDGQDLLRTRDSALAPWRIARTPIPAMRRVRACLLAAAAGFPDDAMRWRYLPEASEVRRACRDVRIVVSGTPAADGGLELEVSFAEPGGGPRVWTPPMHLSYRSLAPRRFEIRGGFHFRRYLLSADDTMHLTTDDRPARPTDPPPLPCETDPARECS